VGPRAPGVTRRELLIAGGAALAARGLAGCATPAEKDAIVSPAKSSRMPVGFVGHGSPMNGVEGAAPASWLAWARSLPRPRAILVVSAHWQATPPRVGARATTDLIYDFGGFPDELYRLRYPAPGAPELAEEVTGLIARAGLAPAQEPGRGLDHGAWVPLLRMFPAADVPVLQVSLGRRVSPKAHLALGRALAPLRASGVFILGSGNVTHNLALAELDAPAGDVDAWAREFDAWCAGALLANDLDALADWAKKAPSAQLAVPTDEHFTPLLVVAAAAAESGKPAVRFPYDAIEARNISMRCVELA
jgi:4,5-DOPA dioxygenase extradiol